jgi:hypothetical protein
MLAGGRCPSSISISSGCNCRLGGLLCVIPGLELLVRLCQAMLLLLLLKNNLSPLLLRRLRRQQWLLLVLLLLLHTLGPVLGLSCRGLAPGLLCWLCSPLPLLSPLLLLLLLLALLQG